MDGDWRHVATSCTVLVLLIYDDVKNITDLYFQLVEKYTVQCDSAIQRTATKEGQGDISGWQNPVPQYVVTIVIGTGEVQCMFSLTIAG